MTDTNTTRRGLLRLATSALAYGAGATAVTATGFAISEAKGATPAMDRRAWDAALTDYRAMRDRLDALPLDSGLNDQACDAMCASLDRLFLTPAPDLAAVGEKLTLLRDTCLDCPVEDDVLAALQADVRRIAGREG
jgi:hypothetical protein